MAQAPEQQSSDSPRDNKTIKEFKGMNTQNKRNAIPEGSFAWLENIQPIGPGHLHSIPGRGSSVTRIPPAGECLPPATQELLEEVAVIPTSGAGLGDNTRRSWSYVEGTATGEIIYELVENFTENPFGVAHLYKIEDGVVTEITPLPISPVPLAGVQLPNVGIADEHMFKFQGDGDLTTGFYRVDSNLTLAVDYHGHGYSTGAPLDYWTKRDDLIWIHHAFKFEGSPPGDVPYLIEVSANTGTWIRDSSCLSAFDAAFAIHAAENYLYCLVRNGSPQTMRIAKIDYTTLTVLDEYDLGLNDVQQIFAMTDNLIYFIRQTSNGGPCQLGYWKNGATGSIIEFVHGSPPSEDYDITPNVLPAEFKTMYAVARTAEETCIYYGSSGNSSGGDQRIVKFCDVVC